MALKSMRHKDLKNIETIIQRIDSVIEYCHGHDFASFSKNTMLIEACVFNLMQIGEICNRDMSDNLKSKYPNIPWHSIYGLRNRIVHAYSDVKLTIVWETIIEDFPDLKQMLVEARQSLMI